MDFENKPAGPFFIKRNLIALFVWCALTVAIVVGITVNAILFSSDRIGSGDVYRRLLFALFCFISISAVYAAEWLLKIRVPLFLELSLSGFAFLSLGVGTVFNVYGVFSGWDKVLHALSGPVFACLGLCVADLLLKNQPMGKKKVIAFITIAFLFTLAVANLWEIFEYAVDSVIPGSNVQRFEGKTGHAALTDTIWDMATALIASVVFLLPLLWILSLEPKRIRWFSVSLKKPKAPVKAAPAEVPAAEQEMKIPEKSELLERNQTEDI